MNEQTRFAINLAMNPNVKSILNIGFRRESDTTIKDICEKNGKLFHILEIYKPNCIEMVKKGWDNIYNLDCRNIKLLNKKWDLIMWLHGPEHVTWNEFLTIREDIESCANKFVLYQAPIGECPQDELYDNPHENHVETLYPENFEIINEVDGWGKYLTILHDKHDEFTFSALKIIGV